MIITVEFLAIFCPLAIGLGGYVWYMVSKKMANKKYNVQNDKGRKYDRKKTTNGIGIRVVQPEPSIEGTSKFKECGELPTAEIENRREKDVSSGKTSNSNGEVRKPTRRRLRNFFSRSSKKRNKK